MGTRAKTEIEGRYANFIVVGHNAVEFILNFGQQFEGRDGPLMHTRIVTAPVYVKAFLKTLDSAVSEFEESHGSIPESEYFNP